MRVLLTGFEPFGGSSVNPSEQLARALAAQPPAGVTLFTAILPVDQEGGPAALLRALDESQPEAVVCVGQAAGRAAISIERVAVNVMDYGQPDNAGRQVVDEPVVPGGPAAYFATLPARALLAALREAGIPAELSLSAGAFLCNQVMYTLLHALAQAGRVVPAGFVHVPALPEQAARGPHPIPSMDLETMRRAVSIVVEAMSRRAGGAA